MIRCQYCHYKTIAGECKYFKCDAITMYNNGINFDNCKGFRERAWSTSSSQVF